MELYVVGRFGTMQLSVKLAAKRGAMRSFLLVPSMWSWTQPSEARRTINNHACFFFGQTHAPALIIHSFILLFRSGDG